MSARFVSARFAGRASVAALALTLTAAGLAFADSIDADSDVVTSGTQSSINLGTVAAGSVHTLDLGFSLVCKGTGHAAVGTTITLTPTTTPAAGGSMTATTATIGPVPSDWPAAGDACVGDPVVAGTAFSHVSLTAPTTAGSNLVYRVTFTRSPSTGTSGTTVAQILLSVAENTPPQLAMPDDISIEGDTTGGWTADYTVTATDAEDGSLPVTCSPAVGDLVPVGHTTVSCSATDSGGLTGNDSFGVDVLDTTAPTLGALPDPAPVAAPDPGGAVVTFGTPTATDVVDPNPTVTCLPASGSTFAVGTTGVTCTAVDASGNHASGSFDVNVTYTPPNTPPKLDLPADMTVEGDTAGGWTAAFTATASDTEDGTAPVSCSASPGDVLPLGHTTVSCSATDGGGLTDTGSFGIDVVDTTAPVLGSLPSPSASTSDPSGTAVTWSSPTASDVVDPSPTVHCVPASGSTFPVGTTSVTCTALDASGNHASGSFDVNVTYVPPTQPPTVTAAWGRPLDSAVPALTGNQGRTIPLKLTVTGSASTPTLRLERLDTCAADAPAVASQSGGTFSGGNGDWQLNLSTSSLAGGCWRLVAVVDGSRAATAVIRLTPDPTATKATTKKK